MVIVKTLDIEKTYGNDAVKIQALKRCSLEVCKGEFVAVVGKSGSGKSTLLRILGSVDKPDAGSVMIAGKDIGKLDDKELSAFRRRQIGYVYQDYNLFDEFTAYENIIMPLALDGRQADKKEILGLMQELSIADCVDKFPAELSGGEQQRTAIARALATHPAVVLADEPTGNLDARNAEEVALLLSKASRMYEQTIIMVTHDMQMADYADRILHIRDGNVEEKAAF